MAHSAASDQFLNLDEQQDPISYGPTDRVYQHGGIYGAFQAQSLTHLGEGARTSTLDLEVTHGGDYRYPSPPLEASRQYLPPSAYPSSILGTGVEDAVEGKSYQQYHNNNNPCTQLVEVPKPLTHAINWYVFSTWYF